MKQFEIIYKKKVYAKNESEALLKAESLQPVFEKVEEREVENLNINDVIVFDARIGKGIIIFKINSMHFGTIGRDMVPKKEIISGNGFYLTEDSRHKKGDVYFVEELYQNDALYRGLRFATNDEIALMEDFQMFLDHTRDYKDIHINDICYDKTSPQDYFIFNGEPDMTTQVYKLLKEHKLGIKATYEEWTGKKELK